jgi:hypothetical protein
MSADFDASVRSYVLEHFLRTGRAPLVAETASGLAQPLSAIQAALQRLHQAHGVVLATSTRELLMVHPFSAVPTAFRVRVADQSWWANCVWDALGIPAMLQRDGSVHTQCGCCGDAMTLTIRNGVLEDNPTGLAHFSVPAKDWWRDIVFT